MENESKPIRFGELAQQIVRNLQAKRSTTGYLKVITGNPSKKIPVNLSMRDERFRYSHSKTTRTRKIGSR